MTIDINLILQLYQNGDVYVGGHYNGKMHGKGQYEWGSGGNRFFTFINKLISYSK